MGRVFPRHDQHGWPLNSGVSAHSVTRQIKGCLGVAFGALMIVAGVFAWFGEVSILLAGTGVALLLVGAGVLLSTQSRSQLRSPHPAIYVILGLAVAVHLYGNLTLVSRDFSSGSFLWALLPYGVVLALACFDGTRIPVVAGAALALVADIWTYHGVAVSTSSTAGLAFLWVPLWNAIIVVPAGTFVAWVLVRMRPNNSLERP